MKFHLFIDYCENFVYFWNDILVPLSGSDIIDRRPSNFNETLVPFIFFVSAFCSEVTIFCYLYFGHSYQFGGRAEPFNSDF